jgi:cytochrome c oxidase subunit 6a
LKHNNNQTMFAQRQITRAVPRLTAQLRNPAVRSTIQRRLASTENAFVKERAAVKEHAADTTGGFSSWKAQLSPP